MSYRRQARYRQVQFKRRVGRIRRRFQGFQTPGLRTVGNMLVSNRHKKHDELNELAVAVALACAFVGGMIGSSIFGLFGFVVLGTVTFFAVLGTLKQHHFLR